MENRKKQLRNFLRQKRKVISIQRRKEASLEAFHKLYQLTKAYPNVLSFASKTEEIDLWPLNKTLCEEKRLLLPYCQENSLAIYRVLNLQSLILNTKYNIQEPEPLEENKIHYLDHIAILVPGIAFSSQGNRLGYGLGFYDRLLQKMTNCLTIGVGFQEQQWEEIPRESHDVILQKVFLF
ncbi:MAG: 5-formyltetrahydrofolate cyclo-ligase [Parachlamydiales bacterium]|nr:5-formyltetrahydrofolate cyclo-ligase [Parachlamydiales bacterium]